MVYHILLILTIILTPISRQTIWCLQLLVGLPVSNGCGTISSSAGLFPNPGFHVRVSELRPRALVIYRCPTPLLRGSFTCCRWLDRCRGSVGKRGIILSVDSNPSEGVGLNYVSFKLVKLHWNPSTRPLSLPYIIKEAQPASSRVATLPRHAERPVRTVPDSQIKLKLKLDTRVCSERLRLHKKIYS